MRIIGVEISKKSNCEKQPAISKSLKYCKSYIHCVRHVGNDDLYHVCHREHDANHRSRNFNKVTMCKTNCELEKFENIVNLIYTLCAMSEMMI